MQKGLTFFKIHFVFNLVNEFVIRLPVRKFYLRLYLDRPGGRQKCEKAKCGNHECQKMLCLHVHYKPLSFDDDSQKFCTNQR